MCLLSGQCLFAEDEGKEWQYFGMVESEWVQTAPKPALSLLMLHHSVDAAMSYKLDFPLANCDLNKYIISNYQNYNCIHLIMIY